jgi:hypothetical protein
LALGVVEGGVLLWANRFRLILAGCPASTCSAIDTQGFAAKTTILA